jgi:dTDP-4-dehydrorhamnose reductase
MTAILLTGGSGQLGTALRLRSWPAGTEVVAPGSEALDLAEPGSIRAALGARRFDVVVNAGAYTAVDQAETDVERTWRVNALAPAVLAEETARLGIPLLQVSTDYVFDGRLDRPYRENDPVCPLSVYGASKEAGEQAVRTGNPRHVVLRTAWVVGPQGRNFLRRMLQLGAERPILRIVDDQQGSPTVAGDLAEAVAVVAMRLASDPRAPSGTYHATNAGETTWFGLAQAIFDVAGSLGHPVPELKPIPTSAFPTPARRPANSRLDPGRLQPDFGVALPPWQPSVAAAVRSCIDAMRGG